MKRTQVTDVLVLLITSFCHHMRCFVAQYDAKPPVYIAPNICSKVGILVPTKFVLTVPASENKEETETMYQT